jgi:hypothetical protein
LSLYYAGASSLSLPVDALRFPTVSQFHNFYCACSCYLLQVSSSIFCHIKKKYIRETGILRSILQNPRSGSEVHKITFFSLPCDETLAIQFPVCSMKVRGYEFWLAGGCVRVTRPAGIGSLLWERNLSASRLATCFVSNTHEHAFHSFDYLCELSLSVFTLLKESTLQSCHFIPKFTVRNTRFFFFGRHSSFSETGFTIE